MRDINTLPLIVFGIKIGFETGFLSVGGFTCGPFVIGAHPFAYDVCCLNGVTEITSADNFVVPLVLGAPSCGDWNIALAYQWPRFVDKSQPGNPIEKIKSSLVYLGWAIHMLEDLCMSGHAFNITGSDHSKYEKEADDHVNSGLFDDTYPIPIDPDSVNPKYSPLPRLAFNPELF